MEDEISSGHETHPITEPFCAETRNSAVSARLNWVFEVDWTYTELILRLDPQLCRCSAQKIGRCSTATARSLKKSGEQHFNGATDDSD